MEQNSGQETPDEINRRLSFGDHDSLPETVAKATSDAEMAQEAVKQLSRQVHDQAEAIKQQNIMMAYLVETVGKLVDQRSPGAPESAQRTGINSGNDTAEDLTECADPNSVAEAEGLNADPNNKDEQTRTGKPKQRTTRAARQLLSVYALARIDKDQYHTHKARTTTNAILLTAWFRKLKPDDVESLMRDVVTRGPTAATAIEQYKTELDNALECKESTLAAMILDVLTSDSKHARSAHLDNIVRVAVNCTSIEGLRARAKLISNSGSYRKCTKASGDIANARGFINFDPAHTDTAEEWWQVLLTMIEGFYGSEVSNGAAERTAEANWRATSLPGIVNGTFAKEEDEQAEDYIAREEMLLDLRRQAERTDEVTTDKERKMNLLAGAGKRLAKATLRALTAENDTVSTITFDELADYLQAADQAEAEKKDIGEILWTQVVQLNNQQPKVAGDKKKKNEEKQPCWHHQHVGGCRFGKDCTKEHIGEAGALRHLHCDDDGVCHHFKTGDCNRGADCKFEHPDGAEQKEVQVRMGVAEAAAEQKRLRKPEAQEYDTSESESSSDDDGWRIQY